MSKHSIPSLAWFMSSNSSEGTSAVQPHQNGASSSNSAQNGHAKTNNYHPRPPPRISEPIRTHHNRVRKKPKKYDSDDDDEEVRNEQMMESSSSSSSDEDSDTDPSYEEGMKAKKTKNNTAEESSDEDEDDSGIQAVINSAATTVFSADSGALDEDINRPQSAKKPTPKGYTTEQHRLLLEIYKEKQLPKCTDYTAISKAMGMTKERVRYWFKNKRRIDRKHQNIQPQEKKKAVEDSDTIQLFLLILQKNPHFTNYGNPALLARSKWNKHQLTCWFQTYRREIGVPPKQGKLTDENLIDLEELFKEHQFVTEWESHDHELFVGVAAATIREWIEQKRQETMAMFLEPEELPCQLALLETSYRDTLVLRDTYQTLLLSKKANLEIEQVVDYFESRRVIDRTYGRLTDEVLTNVRAEVEQAERTDLLGPINGVMLSRKALTDARAIQFFPDLQNTYLPVNMSTDYKTWSATDFQEFAIQFLPRRVVSLFASRGLCGRDATFFYLKNKKFFDRLNIGSPKDQLNITWPEFMAVRDQIFFIKNYHANVAQQNGVISTTN
ncbi:Protein CBR-CEH-99 [Caenorhabditis briggsae]|uniref:Protein CBR-CEH-99 n=1 Tax=Caenorhabditis briggsae TaxID=6238 RepID=A8X4Q9_CAEBR|nr:Protein CBR-CEH-99 [Caenorhabditis briggsae]CAP27619.1 Protein CBR-CEH-99 [Caenorhabditis briggsae]